MSKIENTKVFKMDVNPSKKTDSYLDNIQSSKYKSNNVDTKNLIHKKEAHQLHRLAAANQKIKLKEAVFTLLKE